MDLSRKGKIFTSASGRVTVINLNKKLARTCTHAHTWVRTLSLSHVSRWCTLTHFLPLFLYRPHAYRTYSTIVLLFKKIINSHIYKIWSLKYQVLGGKLSFGIVNMKLKFRLNSKTPRHGQVQAAVSRGLSLLHTGNLVNSSTNTGTHSFSPTLSPSLSHSLTFWPLR